MTTKLEEQLTVRRLVGHLTLKIEKIQSELTIANNNPGAVAKALALISDMKMDCDHALDWGSSYSQDMHQLTCRVEELEKAAKRTTKTK